MLEEALKNEKRNPAEVAVAMLSFVQVELPVGGTSAENRFFRLYIPLCERIFGKILTEKDQFRHSDGGWMSEQTQWSRSSVMATTGSTIQSARHLPGNLQQNTGFSLESDPVVKFLGTAERSSRNENHLPTLIEAISKESSNRPTARFPFPFGALPKSTQGAWLSIVEMSLGGGMQPDGSSRSQTLSFSENEFHLFSGVLRRRPEEQTDLIAFLRRQAVKLDRKQLSQLSPRGYRSNVTPLSPSTGLTAKSPSKSSEPVKEPETNVYLGMLEYYLFMFLRYPLAKPIKAVSTYPSSYRGVNSHHLSRHSFQKHEPYGDAVFSLLLRRYIRHFLPYDREESRHIAFTNDTPDSELFLRIIIALWIEPQGRVKPTPSVVESMDERRRRAGIPQPIVFDLDRSYDLIQVVYDPPFRHILRYFRSVIVYVLQDPGVRYMVTGSHKQWCLTNAMTALQQPFYNFIRTTFRHASIHDKESPFHSAMDLWLMWLEPWNVTQTSNDFSAKNATQRIMGSSPHHPKRALWLPQAGSGSRYDRSWEPYIEANLYLFVVPLAIFLRRARELDFSASRFVSSIQRVKRVLRVFSPIVIDVINRHLSLGSGDQTYLIQRHLEVITPFGPPLGTMSLKSCQKDGTALLEEMQMQHIKNVGEMDVFDRMGAYLEGLFGRGVVSGEERSLHSLIEQIKLLVQLPVEYDVVTHPQSGPGSSATPLQASSGPTLSKDGKLTDEAFQEVLNGTVKCTIPAGNLLRDKMNARIGSHELSILLELSILVADWVQAKTGLRINLRFIADYRNLIFSGFVIYLLAKIFL